MKQEQQKENFILTKSLNRIENIFRLELQLDSKSIYNKSMVSAMVFSTSYFFNVKKIEEIKMKERNVSLQQYYYV